MNQKKTSTPTLIRAAGRVLSKKNEVNLQNAFVLIGKTLIAANVITEAELDGLVKEAKTAPAPKEEEINAEVASSVSHQVLSAAQDFLENVKRATWQDRLRRSLTMFSREFQSIHEINDAEIERRYGKDTNRAELAQKMLDQYFQLLKELNEDHPGPTEDYFYVPPLYGYEMSSAVNAQTPQKEEVANEPQPAATQTQNSRVTEPDVPLPADAVPAPDDGDEDETSTEPTRIKASTPVLEEVQINVVFDRSIKVEVNADKSAATTNKIPFEGVLCSLDEPSPAIPAVGPGLPLYLPKEVAQVCLNAGIGGLPLDADDSFSKHANEQITGVIQGGYIKDNEVYVTGYLWPWNQEKKVAAISANRERLGMSMNASAYGHREVVDNKEVFWIDSLELLGANILYQDRATYRNTRLISASSESWREIAAAAAEGQETAPLETPENKQEQEDIPMDEELRRQLKVITDAIEDSNNRQDDALAPIKTTLAEVQLQVKEIQAERSSAKAELQASADADRQKKERDEFVTQIVSVLDERLETKLNEKLKGVALAATRGGKQPGRQTTPLPLAASAATNPAADSPPQKAIEMQLARLEGRLEEAQGNMQKTLTLLDEKRALETQLSMVLA